MPGKVLPIITMGHPLLRKVSQPVKDPRANEVQILIEDMEATVESLNCSGLAAPQVSIPLRVVLFRIMKTSTNPVYQLTPEYDPEGVPWTLMINPVVTPLSEEIILGWEPCLSLPGLLGKVPRYRSIQYSYLNGEGKEESRIAHGFHARVVQHECDHLDGILYPDRLQDISDLGFREEILKQISTS